MKQKLIVISALFLLLTNCTSTITGEIGGTVIDSSDGSPIPYANVITEPPTSSVTTDTDGKYSIFGVRPGEYTMVAIKGDRTSGRVRILVTERTVTTADLHFGIVQEDLPTSTPNIEPVLSGNNLLTNGDFEERNYGIITNWATTNIELNRWYLVQDIENTRWVEWVELDDRERGYGLKSTDYQNCNYFCSTSAVQIVPARENSVYTLSAEAIRANGKGGKLYIDFLDANRSRIKPYTRGGYSETWSRQEKTAAAPEGTKYIRVILYTDNKDQGVIFWDNVELRGSK